MNLEIENKRQKNIYKANELITKSRFTLSAQQQKIVLYLISQINPFDDEFKLYEFSIKEFCEICNINTSSGRNYEMIKKQIKAIADKSIWIELADGKETLLRWIEKPYIDKEKGTVKIKLDNDMKPFLLQLNSNYTKYELYFILHFKSKYTIRLYEYIKARHFDELQKYSFEISLLELCERLDCKQYENEFKSFHTRVLKPAVLEINQFSEKNIEYELIKQGKKVIGIKFNINTKDVIERMKIYAQLESIYNEEQTKLY